MEAPQAHISCSTPDGAETSRWWKVCSFLFLFCNGSLNLKCEGRSTSKVTRVQNSKVLPSFTFSAFYCVQTIFFYTLVLVTNKIKNNNNNNQRPSHTSHHTSYLLLFVYWFVSIYKVLHNKSFMQSHGLQYVFPSTKTAAKVFELFFCLFVLFFFEAPGFQAREKMCVKSQTGTAGLCTVGLLWKWK